MPSQRITEKIRGKSLAEGEVFEDFAYLFDTLMWLRETYHAKTESSEDVAGRILCVFPPDKPEQYARAMQRFRLRFAGVSGNARLRVEFYNCVRNATIFLSNPEDVEWRPSLYFALSREMQKDLPDWF